jgi:hypothetical protein
MRDFNIVFINFSFDKLITCVVIKGYKKISEADVSRKQSDHYQGCRFAAKALAKILPEFFFHLHH